MMIKKNEATYWALLFIDRNTAVYFDSFGIEYIPQEVLNKIKDKSITHTFRIQDLSIRMQEKICQVILISLQMTIKRMAK